LRDFLKELVLICTAISYPALFVQIMYWTIGLTSEAGRYQATFVHLLISVLVPSLIIIFVGIIVNKYKLLKLSALSSLFAFIYMYLLRPNVPFHELVQIMNHDKPAFINMFLLLLFPIFTAIAANIVLHNKAKQFGR
jgi:hypothetical protein